MTYKIEINKGMTYDQCVKKNNVFTERHRSDWLQRRQFLRHICIESKQCISVKNTFDTDPTLRLT